MLLNTEDAPAGLSAKQCAVLELILQHKSNKEIARILEISPSAVDQRLSAARARLGTLRRGDTALAYAALKTTCVKNTGDFTQVALGQNFVDEDEEDSTEPLLVFEDIGLAGSFPDWPQPERTKASFRDLAVPANPLVRVGLIIIFSLLIAVVALIGLSVTQGVVQILS